MLSLRSDPIQVCDGFTRREVLRAGGLGLMGLSLPQLLQARETSSTPRAAKAKACILLFLFGGPPQHSTWDPKPNTPPEIRGEFKPIPTTLPGLAVGELMPLTAQQCHKICVLRAVSSNDNAHSSSG